MENETRELILESVTRIQKIQKIQKQLHDENKMLMDIILPIAADVESCQEIFSLLPECSVRFDVWRIQQDFINTKQIYYK
jgi:hypothetical protein